MNNPNHTTRNLANGGRILVRSNLVLAGDGVTYGGGVIYITNGATASFTGGRVNNQFIEIPALTPSPATSPSEAGRTTAIALARGCTLTPPTSAPARPVC